MTVTLLMSLVLILALILLVYAAVALIQDNRLFRSSRRISVLPPPTTRKYFPEREPSDGRLQH